MTDLGYTRPKKPGTLGGTPATPVTIVSEDEAENKPSYPSLSLNGAQAKVAGLTKCAHGDEYEITVKIKAKRIGGYGYCCDGGSSDDDAPAMEFDVVACDAPKQVKEFEEEKPKRQKGVMLSPKDAGLESDEEDDGEED